MQAISATNASLKLTTLVHKAQRGPVMIRHNQRNIAVMISATEYQRLSEPVMGAGRPQIDEKLAALLDACD